MLFTTLWVSLSPLEIRLIAYGIEIASDWMQQWRK
jgi:hypothetical protein